MATSAQRRSDRVIVCEAISDADESADVGKGFALERDRRAETGMRKTEPQADDDAGKEMRIDAECGQSRPNPGRGQTVVEAGHRPDAVFVKLGNDAREIS